MKVFSGQSTPWTRSFGIVLYIAVAYLVGSVAADLFQGIGVSITHYPGGLNQLYRVAEPPGWSIAASLLGVWLGLGIGAWFILRRKWVSPLTNLFRAKWSDCLYVALGVGAQVVISFAYAPFHLGPKMDAPVRHLFGGAGSYLWLLGVMSIIGAPIIEEILFRGVMFRGFWENFRERSRKWGPRWAIVASAFLFAGAHFEALQLPGLFFVGLLLAYVVQRTGRLVPSIVTHASFNAVAFSVVAFTQHGKI